MWRSLPGDKALGLTPGPITVLDRTQDTTQQYGHNYHRLMARHTHTHTLGRAPYKNSKYYVSRMLKITVYVSVYNYICICMDVCMSPCRPSLLIEPNCNCKYDNYHYYHCETIYISIMNSITIVILKSYCYGY